MKTYLIILALLTSLTACPLDGIDVAERQTNTCIRTQLCTTNHVWSPTHCRCVRAR